MGRLTGHDTAELYPFVHKVLLLVQPLLEAFRECLTSLFTSPDGSTRKILSVRGRVRHYSLCINYV